ncbi:MAG: chemoreceptor glutamine deamidase CheD [Gammaproteobacteria bacterium]|nr:chemoreceptor glutamine deamidase CheD [Gammaproteobacteria bacterium]
MVTQPQKQRDLEQAKSRALPGFEHLNRYWDHTANHYAIKLLPGEYYVTALDELIVTVLGSCVSACVRDRTTGVGGMNHFMLPQANGATEGHWAGSQVSKSARYGNIAMERLINDILKHGGIRARLEIKIFGGGRILRSMTDVGNRNIAYIRNYIESEALTLTGEDVGDTCPRKVRFFPQSGRVQVKKLRSMHNTTVVTREQTYSESLQSKVPKSEVELF